MLSAAFLISNQSVNAQWVLTGNPTATNADILGATGANINLRIFAGGAAAANERIRITGSNGNVGIGTLAPTTKLHVVGTSRLQGATAIVGATTITGATTISGLTTTGTLKVTGGAPGLNKILRSDAAGLASWITNPVGTNTLNKVPRWNGTQLVTGTIFDTGTSVGVGVTPAARLDVLSTGSFDLFATQGDFRIGNATRSLRMGVALAGGGAGDAYISAVGGTSRLFLGSGASFAGTQMMTVTSTGVGIGNVVAPAFPLEVGGRMRVRSAPANSAGIWFNDDVNITTPAFAGMADNNHVGFYGALGVGWSLNMDCTNGNVGVGTFVNSSKLTVRGSATQTSPVVEAYNSYVGSSDVKGVNAYSKASDGWGIGVEGTGGYKGGNFIAAAGAYTSSAYGVVGDASGTAGTRIGIYGSASNTGGEAWGGYFPTKTYTSELRVGGTQGATGYVAAINGKLIATEVRVALQAAWPDYVFASDYKLMDIHELEQSINTENHLPGLPSACEVEENGLHLGEMQTKIVEKLEESHLYIIQLQKQIDELKTQLNELKK